MELYQKVSLKKDHIESGLQAGDVATLIDFVNHPEGGEQGCVLEIFNAIGETVDVVIVPLSLIEPLKSDEILRVRHFSRLV